MTIDAKDQFIIKHYRSMSLAEMGDKLGCDKSTVSRRLKVLRESGEVEAVDESARKAESATARERLKGCAMDRGARLEALSELKDILHAEIALAGGQGLARVSSEYRQTLAEMENLSVEMGIADDNHAKEVPTIELVKYKVDARKRWGATCEDVDAVVDDVLQWLNDVKVVRFAPLDAIMSTAGADEASA